MVSRYSLLLLLFLAMLHGIWDLNSQIRDRTCTLLRWAHSLNCWRIREVPMSLYLDRRHPSSIS